MSCNQKILSWHVPHFYYYPKVSDNESVAMARRFTDYND